MALLNLHDAVLRYCQSAKTCSSEKVAFNEIDVTAIPKHERRCSPRSNGLYGAANLHRADHGVLR